MWYKYAEKVTVPDEILIEAQSGDCNLSAIGVSKASSNLFGWLMGDVMTGSLTSSGISTEAYIYKRKK